MSFLVGTLICLGVAAVIGGTGAAIHYATEDDRARAQIKQYEEENKSMSSALSHLQNVLRKLEMAKESLLEGRNEFKAGGWVNDGLPLAHDKFEYTIKNLGRSITYASNLIEDLEATIEENNKKIKSERAKLKK